LSGGKERLIIFLVISLRVALPFTLLIECMAHAKGCDRSQAPSRRSDIGLALKWLEVTIFFERLGGDALGWDVHKEMSIRFAREAVFFDESRFVPD